MKINTGTMTVGIFAVLFGLVGAYALRAALADRPSPPPTQEVRTVNVPLAGTNLPVDRRITLGDVTLVPMTFEQMQQSGFNLQTTMLSTDQIVGRYLQEPIAQGKPFNTTSLYPEGARPNPARHLQPGYRAVTVPITDLGAVGGAVGIGAMVDVLFRSTAQPADDGQGRSAIPETTVTLLENVQVIDVSYREIVANNNNQGVDTRRTNQVVETDRLEAVTLAVSPKQAGALKTVQGRGELSLALRGNDGAGTSPSEPMTLENLLGIKPAVKTELEIFRGTSRHTMEFSEGGVQQESFGGYQAPSVTDRTWSDDRADARGSDDAASRGANRPRVIETSDAR